MLVARITLLEQSALDNFSYRIRVHTARIKIKPVSLIDAVRVLMHQRSEPVGRLLVDVLVLRQSRFLSGLEQVHSLVSCHLAAQLLADRLGLHASAHALDACGLGFLQQCRITVFADAECLFSPFLALARGISLLAGEPVT